MTVTITLTAYGSNTGPFDLYSDATGSFVLFESGVAKNDLITGYTTALVPDWTNTIRLVSTGMCTNYINVSVIPYTTTTSTSSTSTTTTTVTTAIPTYTSFDVRLGVTDPADCCSDPTLTVYTTYGLTWTAGTVLYADPLFHIPVTGYDYILQVDTDGSIWDLNDITGALEGDSGEPPCPV